MYNLATGRREPEKPRPDREHWEMSMDILAKELIGMVVVAIDPTKGTITLDNGTVLELEDQSDCCAWFAGRLTEGHLTENAVTAIEINDMESDAPESWRIHVLAIEDEIATVDVWGDSTSGYYCHSIGLNVYINKENS